MIAATENAVRSVGADAIVNPAVDDERGIGFLGLWCWQKIKVYGTAVRFKRNAAPPAAAAPVFRTEKGQAQVDKGQVQSEIDSISEMENRIFKSK